MLAYLPHSQLYLHDKPEPGLNCPQDVYNVLTQAIDGWHFETEFHSYIFEAHAVKKLRVNMVRVFNHPVDCSCVFCIFQGISTVVVIDVTYFSPTAFVA